VEAVLYLFSLVTSLASVPVPSAEAFTLNTSVRFFKPSSAWRLPFSSPLDADLMLKPDDFS